MSNEPTPSDDEVTVSRDDNTFDHYYVIGNIPSQFHSADLRAYFSQFTEKKGFKCFHYRHRPQVAMTTSDGSQGPNYCCCIIRVGTNMADEFLHLYNNQTWELASGELVNGLVKIYPVDDDSLKSKLLNIFVYQYYVFQDHSCALAFHCSLTVFCIFH